MNKKIKITTGIYDSEYTMVEHANGTITVRIPYVKWDNNTGTLAFEKRTYQGKRAEKIKEFFEKNNTVIDTPEYECPCMTLNDILNGEYPDLDKPY
jgi:hypothetical protein